MSMMTCDGCNDAVDTDFHEMPCLKIDDIALNLCGKCGDAAIDALKELFGGGIC